MDFHEDLPEEVEFEGISYSVISLFHTGYLLVVEKESTFPSTPVIIPHILKKMNNIT